MSNPENTTPRETVLATVSDEELQKHATRITRQLAKAAKAVIDTGPLLIRAKDRLPHGQFLRLFHDHDNPVRDPIPIGEREAQRFMAVARHPILTNPTHGSGLPPNAHTLYELSRVPNDRLVRAIESGEVHPTMERTAAVALRDASGVRLRKPRAKAPHEHRNDEREITRTVNELFLKCPDKRAFLVAEVLSLVRAFGMPTSETSALMGDLIARLRSPRTLPQQDADRMLDALNTNESEGEAEASR